MNAWLEAQGYRCYGPNRLKPGSLLWQKRRRDADGGGDGPGPGCYIEVWEWPEHPNGPCYEVEGYWETAAGYAARLLLYTFTAEQLQAQLTELEAVCVTLWQTYSRKEETS